MFWKIQVKKKIQVPRYCLFFSKALDVYNEQPCLETTGLCEDLFLFSSLFHFFYFIFSRPTSFSLFSNFSVSSFFNIFFLKPLSSIVEKLVYMYANIICIIYILENLWIFAKLKNYDIFIPLVWLSMNRMLDL